MAVTVVKTRCPQNHACPSIAVCPTGALKQDGFAAPVVDAARCTDCGACAQFCPKNALTL